jgi:hypothetical protein
MRSRQKCDACGPYMHFTLQEIISAFSSIRLTSAASPPRSAGGFYAAPWRDRVVIRMLEISFRVHSGLWNTARGCIGAVEITQPSATFLTLFSATRLNPGRPCNTNHLMAYYHLFVLWIEPSLSNAHVSRRQFIPD